jgi:CheY-like chemotaxis protein
MLLVEDNPADVLLLETALSEYNLSPELLVVSDGELAIKYVEDIDCAGRTGPDLFVLDLNLPKRSGLEVLRKIRFDRRLFGKKGAEARMGKEEMLFGQFGFRHTAKGVRLSPSQLTGDQV